MMVVIGLVYGRCRDEHLGPCPLELLVHIQDSAGAELGQVEEATEAHETEGEEDEGDQELLSRSKGLGPRLACP